jgi:hypothetical protein
VSSRAEAPTPPDRAAQDAEDETGDSAAAPDARRAGDLPSLEEVAELSTAAQAKSEASQLQRRAPSAAPALRIARIVEVDGRRAIVAWRRGGRIDAEVAPEVEPTVVARALADGEAVLVEVADGQTPVVVGVVTTRAPREAVVQARTIHLEAEHEIVLRAGRAALRLRDDGDVEIVGSRISAASRGLFRLVGRILRLN